MNRTFHALAVALAIFSVGCVSHLATGPLFRQTENVYPKQSVIYVYYPYSTDATNSMHGLYKDGVLATRLDYGGYVSFVSSPGNASFSLLGYEKSHHVLDVVAERTYFLKVTGQSGFKGYNWYKLEEVEESQALQEISRCRLMEPPDKNECAGLKSGLIACVRTPRN